ncbi:hypothetical protein SEVIR_3G088501v4 [Setaria viridis]
MRRDGDVCDLLSFRSLQDDGLQDHHAIDRPTPLLLLLLLSLFPPLRHQRELLSDCRQHRASRRRGVAGGGGGGGAAPRGRRRRRGRGAIQGAVEWRLAEGHHGHEPLLHRRRHWGEDSVSMRLVQFEGSSQPRTGFI